MGAHRRTVTIEIDAILAKNARGYARVHECSLSDVVEAALRDKIGDEEYPSFAEYWQGKFRPDGLSDEELLAASDEPRYQHLMRRYLSLDDPERS